MFGGGMNMGDMFAKEETLIVNLNNPLIKRVISLNDLKDKKGIVKMICEQVYDLARMSHEPLDANAMSKFLERSNLLLSKVAE
jgi:molecular chaperone HtpG